MCLFRLSIVTVRHIGILLHALCVVLLAAGTAAAVVTVAAVLSHIKMQC